MSGLLKNRLAVMFYFFLGGISYGMVIARMPALKIQSMADNFSVGMILFSLGGASFLSILACKKVLDGHSSKMVLFMNSLLLSLVLCFAGFCTSVWRLCLSFALMGVSIGMIDTAANVQGVNFESKAKKPSMNLFHAFFSRAA